MKQEIPTWAAIVAIVLILGLAVVFLWQGTNRSSGEVVVPKTFGSESDPFGGQGSPTPQTGAGASGP